jgi:hypothetical protein
MEACMRAGAMVMLLLCAMQVHAEGERSRSVVFKDLPDPPLSGNLKADLFANRSWESGESPTIQTDYKSPWLAGGMSLLVPGAGEVYTARYWEAGAFFAIGVVAWTLAYSFDKKGDDQTAFYRSFADQHWSVVRYAQYANDNLLQFIPDPGSRVYNWLIPGTEGLHPWLRVNWGELNRMERAIGLTSEGQYYSHTLPLYGEQQYFELIGKYQQYNQGWSDAPPSYQYGEPVTQRFQYYAIERGKANTQYEWATRMVTAAVINHLVNAVYAALSARWYNTARAEVGIQRIPVDDLLVEVPVVKVTYGF